MSRGVSELNATPDLARIRAAVEAQAREAERRRVQSRSWEDEPKARWDLPHLESEFQARLQERALEAGAGD